MPVLHDAVEWNLQFAVLVEYLAQLVAGLVALAALPVAHGPEGEHGGLTRELADRGDDTVLSTIAIEEVVVDTLCHLRTEGCCFGSILKKAAAGIVPIESVALYRGKVRNGDVGIMIPYLHLLATLVELGAAALAKAIDSLVGSELEILSYAKLTFIDT